MQNDLVYLLSIEVEEKLKIGSGNGDVSKKCFISLSITNLNPLDELKPLTCEHSYKLVFPRIFDQLLQIKYI